MPQWRAVVGLQLPPLPPRLAQRSGRTQDWRGCARPRSAWGAWPRHHCLRNGQRHPPQACRRLAATWLVGGPPWPTPTPACLRPFSPVQLNAQSATKAGGSRVGPRRRRCPARAQARPSARPPGAPEAGSRRVAPLRPHAPGPQLRVRRPRHRPPRPGSRSGRPRPKRFTCIQHSLRGWHWMRGYQSRGRDSWKHRLQSASLAWMPAYHSPRERNGLSEAVWKWPASWHLLAWRREACMAGGQECGAPSLRHTGTAWVKC